MNHVSSFREGPALRVEHFDHAALVLDLVQWIAQAPRTYAQVMDAWRTSCPRLTIWEDATDAALVRRVGSRIEVTERGREFLQAHRGGD